MYDIFHTVVLNIQAGEYNPERAAQDKYRIHLLWFNYFFFSERSSIIQVAARIKLITIPIFMRAIL